MQSPLYRRNNSVTAERPLHPIQTDTDWVSISLREKRIAEVVTLPPTWTAKPLETTDWYVEFRLIENDLGEIALAVCLRISVTEGESQSQHVLIPFEESVMEDEVVDQSSEREKTDVVFVLDDATFYLGLCCKKPLTLIRLLRQHKIACRDLMLPLVYARIANLLRVVFTEHGNGALDCTAYIGSWKDSAVVPPDVGKLLFA